MITKTIVIFSILITMMTLGCITKIEPSGNVDVVLDNNNPSQTYKIFTDSAEDNIEISIDDVYQMTLASYVRDPDGGGGRIFLYSVNGNNLSKGDHDIKFHSDDGTSIRSITNLVSNDIKSSSVLIANSSKEPVVPMIIPWDIVIQGIILIIILLIIWRIIIEFNKKGEIFKDLILICTKCSYTEVYHNIEKNKLINIYKCRRCDNPRIIETDIKKADKYKMNNDKSLEDDFSEYRV